MLIVTQGKKRLLPGVVKLAQVHGGVWWCIVVYGGVYISSDAGEAKKAPKTAETFTQTDPIVAGTCVRCKSSMLP